jgi:hypothetical protein
VITGTPPSMLDGPLEGLVTIADREFYAIPDVDHMAPFLMSVVSDGDRWMFVSSTGGLTAGRRDATRALFPYETDDRLHRAAGAAGAVTALRVHDGDEVVVWQPFHGEAPPGARRHVYKSVTGDAVVFEETHEALALSFRYRWSSAEDLGFVRTAKLRNHGSSAVTVEVLDGLVGILPHGVDPALHRTLSNLSNAYKRSEIIDDASRLAVFSLESAVVDRAEPEEVLRASVVWSSGLDGAAVTLDQGAMRSRVADEPITHARLVTGTPGAYLLDARIEMGPGAARTWHVVAEVAVDQPGLVALRSAIAEMEDASAAIARSVAAAGDALVGIMAPADALQRTGDEIASAHHFANVTYNVMRGGIPLDGYDLLTSDLRKLVATRNRRAAERHAAWFDSLPPRIGRRELLERAAATSDPHLERLCAEYLPFGFSRRHGDPSRPWNQFSIRLRDDEGRPVLYYEGNWRDIFQNWEALAMSFPEYLTGIVATFVNASTPDGFNPYRITREGIDWETPDEDDPWANIGYWGDHQIVYLLRLLEAAERHLPGELEHLLVERRFTYADVPYRIVPYEELVADPKTTIEYDEGGASRTATRVAAEGTDGRLLWDGDAPKLVTLLEKLLVPALAKLSNFVPGGGIWMNTQRPEWNDANNALVGHGLSMVTLYELRRYLSHLRTLVTASGNVSFELSSEVADWLATVTSVFRADVQSAEDMSPTARKTMLDALAAAFTTYRETVYRAGLSGAAPVAVDNVTALCETAIAHLDATIIASRRTDGLYHSYNLVSFSPDRSAAHITHLYEMLEGQVAVLESGVLAPGERADVVDALFESAMYRRDQDSFMLYPARRLPSFLHKNVIPQEVVAANPLLSALLEAGDRSIVVTDPTGAVRFHADLTAVEDLERALDALDERWDSAAHRASVLEAYRHVFGHHSYTGRSGSMYGYEGIGSIYWHMVAKLLVAVQRSVLDAIAAGATAGTVDRLRTAYWRVRDGLGFNKPARVHGAIPLDPYSHTPAHAGAQQPGMTGLVKEEILTRLLELGVRVDEGELHFDGVLLRDAELLDENVVWSYRDVVGREEEIALVPGSFGLTVCQVPVVVSRTDGPGWVAVHLDDETDRRVEGTRLGADLTRAVFGRTGRVTRIEAVVPTSS